MFTVNISQLVCIWQKIAGRMVKKMEMTRLRWCKIVPKMTSSLLISRVNQSHPRNCSSSNVAHYEPERTPAPSGTREPDALGDHSSIRGWGGGGGLKVLGGVRICSEPPQHQPEEVRGQLRIQKLCSFWMDRCFTMHI